MEAATAFLEGRNLRKTYRLSRRNQVNALRGVEIRIEHGEMVALMGPSGSGKSTLMHILGLLHSPDDDQGPPAELSIPDWLPTPGNLRMRRAVRRLDRIVYRLIAVRRVTDRRGDDAISMLLEASSGEAKQLTDRELRDEVMTLFMAAHETTAVALAWSLHLLSGSTEAAAALETELADVLSGRLPTVADLPRLRYTEAVVLEALRLYPPAYALSREAIKPTTVAGRALPKGGIAFISVWATHRRPDLFEAPSTFRPERWLDGLARRLPRGAYLPFAEGPRKCIGASFAMQEAVLVLATIARRFSVRPVAVEEIPRRPAVTLRPAEPIRLTVRARSARRQAT